MFSIWGLGPKEFGPKGFGPKEGLLVPVANVSRQNLNAMEDLIV